MECLAQFSASAGVSCHVRRRQLTFERGGQKKDSLLVWEREGAGLNFVERKESSFVLARHTQGLVLLYQEEIASKGFMFIMEDSAGLFWSFQER
ncbi:hypothetical protein TNCV_584331 [Trichonephila clavipes]|nr:hypothetical protein TNCV_584331 [Trichonephila clavipes]